MADAACRCCHAPPPMKRRCLMITLLYITFYVAAAITPMLPLPRATAPLFIFRALMLLSADVAAIHATLRHATRYDLFRFRRLRRLMPPRCRCYFSPLYASAIATLTPPPLRCRAPLRRHCRCFAAVRNTAYTAARHIEEQWRRVYRRCFVATSYAPAAFAAMLPMPPLMLTRLCRRRSPLISP